ncbi:MAG: ABC transporter permease [Cellulomonas sp.]
MSISWRRVRAMMRKELRDLRRNRVVLLTMSVAPVIFVVMPMVQIFAIHAATPSKNLSARIGLSLLYMLIIPAVVPSALAAYAIVGEREQGTLESLLITPIRGVEILLGKALAVLLPTLAIAYAVLGVFFAAVALFADPVVATAVFETSHVLVPLLFTPLLAGWSIWAGIAVSTRATDVRVAQQTATFASFPPLVLAALMSFGVITPSVRLALILAAALLAIDVLGWRLVAAGMDRERLVVGRRR